MDDNRYMTLAIVFNPEKNKVLMCWHRNQKSYNFIGGKSQVAEDYDVTTYRELFEETGISRDDVELEFLRQESVACKVPGYKECWVLHVMTGVLKHDVQLKAERNLLEWIPVTKHEVFQYESFGNGNCWLYLREAASKLSIDVFD